MNRYGDTPLGMVESALEFVRICESHGFRELVLSMKASNPKVMVQAYRLAAARMGELGMDYPLHLGVTEAGEGEDARIKSSVGMGALLADGLGDTVRVSLTEDPWHEIPVCRELVRRAERLVAADGKASAHPADPADPFQFTRRPAPAITLRSGCLAGADHPPRVVVRGATGLEDWRQAVKELLEANAAQREAKAEGLLLEVRSAADLPALASVRKALGPTLPSVWAETALKAEDFDFAGEGSTLVVVRRFGAGDGAELGRWIGRCAAAGARLAVDLGPQDVGPLADALRGAPEGMLVACCSKPSPDMHAIGTHRQLVRALQEHSVAAPLWIRANGPNATLLDEGFQSRLMEASILVGSLLVDGYGDLVSCETPVNAAKSLSLGYDVLQGARARQTKTEYVACPSCGRTLFDIQSTTLKIKERTGHLKSVTIAVMGCIVNGPGEMADADFGYVGGAPGKINLYVGKTPVKFNIPQEEAVDRLVDLIKERGKWEEAGTSPASSRQG